MPQLDPTWIISQVFWALIFFSLIFISMKVLILPKITSVMDARDNQIESDINIAKGLKQELEDAIKAYEKSLDQAYEKSGEILKQATIEMQDFVKKEEADFSSKMKSRTDEAKAKIENSKEKVLVEIETIAVELSGKILEKIVLEKFPEEVIRTQINKEMKEA